MKTWAKKRIAVSSLLKVGKSINAIITDLGVSRYLVLKVKWFAAGKELQSFPRKSKKPVLTPRVVGGLKTESRRHR